MADPREAHGPSAPPDAAGKRQAPTGGVGPSSSSGMGGGGRSLLGPSGAGPGPALDKSYTIPPWYDVRPPSAREIQVRGWQAGYTVANTPAAIPGTLFNLPEARTGVIKSLGIQVNNLLLTSQVFWSLHFDGQPVQGWSALTMFPTPAAFFQDTYGPEESTIMVPEGSSIEIIVDVLDAGTYLMGANYHGWSVAQRLATLQEEISKV